MKIYTCIFIILNLLILGSCKKVESKFPENIGDINFDPSLDRKDFKLCDSKNIVQYYSVNTDYKDGRKALYEEIYDKFRFNNDYITQSGILTVRFVVNCEGKTDRFRVMEVDKNYQEKKFSPTFKTYIVDIIKSLSDWIPGEKDGKKYDSYMYITMQIGDGMIKTITP